MEKEEVKRNLGIAAKMYQEPSVPSYHPKKLQGDEMLFFIGLKIRQYIAFLFFKLLPMRSTSNSTSFSDNGEWRVISWVQD